MTETANAVTYRAWCEHDGCDWEQETTDPDPVRVQEKSSRRMFAHGMATGHHETYHEKVDRDCDEVGD